MTLLSVRLAKFWDQFFSRAVLIHSGGSRGRERSTFRDNRQSSLSVDHPDRDAPCLARAAKWEGRASKVAIISSCSFSVKSSAAAARTTSATCPMPYDDVDRRGKGRGSIICRSHDGFLTLARVIFCDSCSVAFSNLFLCRAQICGIDGSNSFQSRYLVLVQG